MPCWSQPYNYADRLIMDPYEAGYEISPRGDYEPNVAPE